MGRQPGAACCLGRHQAATAATHRLLQPGAQRQQLPAVHVFELLQRSVRRRLGGGVAVARTAIGGNVISLSGNESQIAPDVGFCLVRRPRAAVHVTLFLGARWAP